MNVRIYVQYLSFKSFDTIKNVVSWNLNKEEVAKETLIGLASIQYGCSNLLYRGATLTFFQCSDI